MAKRKQSRPRKKNDSEMPKPTPSVAVKETKNRKINWALIVAIMAIWPAYYSFFKLITRGPKLEIHLLGNITGIDPTYAGSIRPDSFLMLLPLEIINKGDEPFFTSRYTFKVNDNGDNWEATPIVITDSVNLSNLELEVDFTENPVKKDLAQIRQINPKDNFAGYLLLRSPKRVPLTATCTFSAISSSDEKFDYVNMLDPNDLDDAVIPQTGVRIRKRKL